MITVIVDLFRLNDSIEGAEKAGDITALTQYQKIGESIIEKIKSFALEHGSQTKFQTFTKSVFEVTNPDKMDELEYLIESIKADVKVDIAIGMGLNLNEATSALEKSKQTGNIEFFHDQDEYYTKKPEAQVDEIADKVQANQSGDVLPPTIEEELQGKKQLVDALAQEQVEQMQQQMAQQQQMQAQQQAQQAQQPQGQEQANQESNQDDDSELIPDEDQGAQQAQQQAAPEQQPTQQQAQQATKAEVNPEKQKKQAEDRILRRLAKDSAKEHGHSEKFAHNLLRMLRGYNG